MFLRTALVLATLLPLPATLLAADFYVAPEGDDHWSGTLASPKNDGKDGPFRTIAQARNAVRQLQKQHQGAARGITVEIAPGIYPLSSSLSFNESDSGTKETPITYRAPHGEVRLIGGKIISGFRPVSDDGIRQRLSEPARNAVMEVHLPSAGVTDFGHIAPSGFGRPERLSHLELFFNGEPMRLAEWPNRQWATIASVPKGEPIVDSSGKTRGTRADRFQYGGDRPERWKSLDDVWVHGYWFLDWADQYLEVKDIDVAAHTVVIEPPQSGYGYKKGQRYRFLNVLEELDEPGEYYLDRRTGMLYFWPPGPLDGSVATVSLLAEPLVDVRGASHQRFLGLTLECSRSDGVVIAGGEDVLLAGCELRNLGGAGVRVSGGRNHRVQSCDLHHLGDGGIFLEGGDRRTLTPGGHAADNNHIHHYSRWVRTYRVGISLSGAGLRASHNWIHDAPHSGLTYRGNDHLIEYNELSDLCQDTGDVGGIYTGRDWSARGTVLRFNHLHHLGGVNMGSNAIYLDDLASGQTIYGNVIDHVWRAMMIGGGRDNVVENNLLADYRIGIHFDARGIGWSRKLIEGRRGAWDMFGRLESVPYNRPPYSTRYPGLENILNEQPLEPKNNRICRNVFLGKQWLDAKGFTSQQAEERGWARFDGNLIDADPGFVDRPSGDFRLRPDSAARQLGFKEIPLVQIGLMVDEFRRTLPDRDHRASPDE